MAENIPLDGIPEQLDQQQVLAFLQGKCALHVNFYILKPSIVSNWPGLMAHSRYMLSFEYIFKRKFIVLLPYCHREVWAC